MFYSIPAEIDLSNYGLSTNCLDEFHIEGILGSGETKMTVPQLVNTLETIYCGPIAVEFDHLQVCLLCFFTCYFNESLLLYCIIKAMWGTCLTYM